LVFLTENPGKVDIPVGPIRTQAETATVYTWDRFVMSASSWYRMPEALRAWDALPHGICLIDEEQVIWAWNSALVAWTGRDVDEVVGRRIDHLFPAFGQSPLDEGLRDVLEQGATRRFEATSSPYFPASTANEAVITVQELVVRPADELRRAALITVLEAAHQPRRPSQDDDAVQTHQLLEDQAVELRAKNRELHDARLRAEAAVRAKSAFLANMSHEIRTPMTAILGFAEVLLHEEGLERAPPQRREAIETIQRNGEHLLGVINDILDVSKIESGKMSIEKISCSPFQIVEDVVSLMRVRAIAKGLELLKEYRFPIPAQIESDPTRLRQVLMNLLGNAIKFTEHGSVRIVTTYLADPMPRLGFEVIDTGVGVSQEEAAKLFQPFSQADSSTTRKFGGTGLGLTICKRLAEMLGGGISLMSSPGNGSTFSFWINLVSVEGVPMRHCARREPPVELPAVQHPGRRETDHLPGCRILLAEDGPDNRRLISFLLQKAGAEVTFVENGKAAVDAAQAAENSDASFDVILMDMQMPVMDGYEATRVLRSHGYRRPIVALTANAMTGDREKCLASGCDDFATKPINKARLFETIVRAVRNFETVTSS
jgi:signal transduction histidine kinase